MTAPNAPQLHVIFGAGQIGTPLAMHLRGQGHHVRLVRRSGGGPEGIEVRQGDAGDPAFARECAVGASAVYHCMNPAYTVRDWSRELPRLADSLVAAAGRAGARLVVLDNVYLFGRHGGVPLTEDATPAPCSRKGEVRARVDARLMDAHRRGDARLVVGRASDFYGPGGTSTYFGDVFWPKALARGEAPVITRLDTPHTYHYTLDVAAGLAALGTAGDDVTGRWWVLPCAPAVSTRAMIEGFARALGRPLTPRALMPAPMLRLLRHVVPMLRELGEMAYQWDEPFVLDDRRLRERTGLAPTAIEQGARATVEWARAHYAAKR